MPLRRSIRELIFRLRKLKLEIARILKEEGYINNFVIKGEG
jgi:ribosomal protein S8